MCAQSNASFPPVVITRVRMQSERLSRLLSAAGFETFHLPMIEVRSCVDEDEFRNVVRDLAHDSCSAIVFSSSNGVRMFGATLRALGLILPHAVRCAAQGDATASAVRGELTREPFLIGVGSGSQRGENHPAVAERFASALLEELPPGCRVVCAGAKASRGVLSRELSTRFSVIELPLYETISRSYEPSVSTALMQYASQGALVLLYSPSAVKGLENQAQGSLANLEGARLVSIGPVTSAAIKECGGTVFFEAPEQSDSSVVEGLTAMFRSNG